MVCQTRRKRGRRSYRRGRRVYRPRYVTRARGGARPVGHQRMLRPQYPQRARVPYPIWKRRMRLKLALGREERKESEYDLPW